MAEALQVPGEPSLTAADVDGQPARRRHELEEAIPVKAPVGVVPGLSCPAHPRLRLTLPKVAQHHEASVVGGGLWEDSSQCEGTGASSTDSTSHPMAGASSSAARAS